MEGAVLMHGSFDQSISPYKSHIGNPKRIHHPFIARSSSENFFPPHFHAMGLLQPPPPFLSHSYPPYSLHQPPLLPLPAGSPRRCTAPIANKKANNGYRRDSSLTPKKSKTPAKTSPKKEVKNPISPNSVIVSSITSVSGPDLYSNVSNCLNSNTSLSLPKAVEDHHDKVDMFSGSAAFTISPPPSSLPLPNFSLRPKLSCKAKAAGIDTGATDNLRRLLRLR